MSRFLRAAFLAAMMGAGPAMAQPAGGAAPLSISHDGIERHYYVFVPEIVIALGDVVPLVLVLHGAGGSPAEVAGLSDFLRKALSERFIVAFPEGTPYSGGFAWNAGACCGPPITEAVDDVGFIAELIDEMVAEYPIDPTRVYVAGHSNGGMMAHRLAQEIPERIAAIGTVVGAMFGNERPPPLPVPAIVINAERDPVIPVDGYPPTGERDGLWDGGGIMPAAYQPAFWANANGCATGPDVFVTDVFQLWRYSCPAGGEVEYYLLNSDSHLWPNERQALAFEATDVIWDFFARHRR